MSKIKLTGSNSGYVEIDSAADAGNLTLTLPTSGVRLLSNTDNVFSGITTTAELDINGKIDVSTDIVGGRNLKVTGITTLSDDVTFTGGSYNVLWDKSDNALEFGDNAVIKIGSSGDLELFHDGNNSYIKEVGTGALYIRGSEIQLQSVAGEQMIGAFTDGGVTIRYDNSIKLATTQTGVNITGICTATSFSGDGSALTGVSSPLSNRNMVMNGAAMISQRLGSSTYNLTSATDYFVADRFRCWAIGGGSLTIQKSDNAPAGFQNSLMFTVNTADTDALSQGNTYYIMQQRIEGYNTRRLNMGQSNAQSSTLSFWVKSDVTGTYCVMLNNNAQNRCYMKEFTVSSADTWEYKTLTYPGDTTGTWLHNNLSGVQLNWCLASGSHYQGTKDQWNTSWKDHTSNQVNFMATSGNKIRFTGIQLEKGTTATEFEHREFGDELSRCHRYFYKMPMNSHDANHGAHPAYQYHPSYKMIVNDYPVVMRAIPTATFTIGNPNVASSFNVFNISEKQFKAYKSSGYSASESFYLRSFEVTAEL